VRRFVDTNVLLRALVQDDPQRSDASIALIRRINRGEELAVTNHAVLTEVVFVLLKSYRTSKADTRQLVTSILNMKGLDVPHRDLFQEALDVFERLNISFGDAYVAVLMKDQGIDEIYSWDTEFDRVPWLTRITPPSPDG
jgi:predicted nucleic acid-binding protein